MRLDQHLVERGLVESRSRARLLIREGQVSVNGAVVTKPSATFRSGDIVEVDGGYTDYVSRGAVKLAHALDTFRFNPAGRVCLDLGASTGGFTEVLLGADAAKVYAVDVGHGQLHPRVADDDRVINLEKTHAKDLCQELVPDPVEGLVCDVSFISLKKALPSALALCAPGAFLIALIKPQFELGPDFIGKGGLVTADEAALADLCADMREWVTGFGWQVAGVTDSPITGGDGNREFLLGATTP